MSQPASFLVWRTVEDLIVEFPKCALIGSAFAGFGSPQRFRPEKGEMHVAMTHNACFYVDFIDLATRASCETLAVRSLEIAEFDNGHRRVGIAFEVTSLGNHLSHDFIQVGRNLFGFCA